MKRILTAMAAVLAVAIVVIAAAPDTNGAGAGTLEDPNYIIGESNAPYDIGDGVTTEIKFNKNAFTGTPSFKVYQKTEGENGGYSITDIGANGTATVDGFKLTINEVPESEGTYKIEIVKDTTSATSKTESKFMIGTFITETWIRDDITTTQKYFWGVNIKAPYVGGEIILNEILEEGTSPLTTGNSSENAYRIDFEKKVDISIETNPAGTFYYYAIGLPKGISVTTQGHIAGMLSERETSRGGSFEITAVNSNTILKKTVYYDIGSKIDKKELKFNIGGKENPQYVLVNSGEDVKVTDITIGGNNIVTSKLNIASSPNLSSFYDWTEEDGKDVLLIKTESLGLGSFRIDMTYKDSGFKTVTESFQVFVVGGIYDSNIDPTVQGKVNG